MNEAARRELQVLRKVAKLMPRGISGANWSRVAPQAADLSLLGQLIRDTYGEDRMAEIATQFDSDEYWMDDVAKRLYEDLERVLHGHPLLHKTAVAVFPNLMTTAISADLEDGTYGIAVNWGMIHVSNRLALALMLAADCPDEKGKLAYESALRLSRIHGAAEFYSELAGMRDVVSVPFLVAAGAPAGLVHRFFALHEFGHIALGHFEAPATDDDTQAHVREFAADVFAIDALLRSTESHAVMWNNALFICAFFCFLGDHEANIGEVICPRHPAPRDRSAYIFSYLCDVMGPPGNDAFNWMQLTFNSWKGLYMAEIPMTIYGDSALLASVFQGEQELIADGIKVQLKGVKRQLGMTAEEMAINVAISVVTGLPVNMLASYLYEKFCQGGKHPLRFEDEVLSELAEIRAHLETLDTPKDN